MEKLSTKFADQGYANPVAELRNLRQTNSLQEYINAFDRLYLRANIREEHSLSSFLNELSNELQILVRMFK